MSIRRAIVADAQDIWRWRNDVDTRAVSRNSATVTWNDHRAWFERRLADPSTLMLIGMADERAVGVVRFDRTSESTADVSINLAPEYRGRGLGKALLRAGCAFASNDGFAAIFDAEILSANLSSQRIFEQAGFAQIAAQGQWLKFQQRA